MRRVGSQGRSGLAEHLVPTGIRSRTVHSVAQSLYRLSHLAYSDITYNYIILLQKHKYNEINYPIFFCSKTYYWVTYICCKTTLSNTISKPVTEATTVPSEYVIYPYFVVKTQWPSNTRASIEHPLKLLLILTWHKWVFWVKCPCTEITLMSRRVIFSSGQRSELWYGNQVNTPNFMPVPTTLFFVGLLYPLCITSRSLLTIMKLHILNFEK